MKKKIFFSLALIILSYLLFNGFKIYNYSYEYSEQKCDIGIVLGAGTNNGELSPIFKERVNHSIYLYKKGIIPKIIFTSGFGANQKSADSEIAKKYALKNDILESDIFIETVSKYTIENLIESKSIIDSLNLTTVLIVSDPMHMKRSTALAKTLNIDCKPSPTKTTMYKSFWPKTKFLIYETFYYTLGQISGKN